MHLCTQRLPAGLDRRVKGEDDDVSWGVWGEDNGEGGLKVSALLGEQMVCNGDMQGKGHQVK
jgi:hypothetical protein